MKVTAFVGSARKNNTYRATEDFLKKLESLGEVQYEIVQLSDYDLKVCKGCSLCLNKGEEYCPLKDDRDILFEKIESSDGIVFATPNYSFGVSGMMKVFLDRFGFVFHRPRFFGKTFTNIVTQGVYGGNRIVKYMDFIGNALGTNVKGTCINTREPMTDKRKAKNDLQLEKLATRFHKQLSRKGLPSPSLFELMIFNMSRKGIMRELNEDFRDYNYFKEKGWFESEFYYPVKLDPVKKLASKIFNII